LNFFKRRTFQSKFRVGDFFDEMDLARPCQELLSNMKVDVPEVTDDNSKMSYFWSLLQTTNKKVLSTFEVLHVKMQKPGRLTPGFHS